MKDLKKCSLRELFEIRRESINKGVEESKKGNEDKAQRIFKKGEKAQAELNDRIYGK